MGPKLLGGGASLLAAAFILALPSIFEGEPSDEVEPISFGPAPVSAVSGALQVTARRRPEPEQPDPASVVPVASPELVAPSGEWSRDGGAATGVPGAFAEDPTSDESAGSGGGGGSEDVTTGQGEGESGDLDDDGDDRAGESESWETGAEEGDEEDDDEGDGEGEVDD